MAIDVFGAEQLVTSITDIIGFQYQLPWKFPLHAQVIVVNVGIPNAFGEDDTRQDRPVRAKRSPASQVTGSLRSGSLSGVGWRATKSGRRTAGCASCRGTGSRSVNKLVHIAVQEVIDEVERVVREVPAGVG